MREIKFRAWDGRKIIYLNRSSEPAYFHQIICGVYGNIFPMQYTGLKDKNGKEIYEGDILKRVGVWAHYAEHVGGTFEEQHEVKWCESDTSWLPFSETSHDMDEYTVIGNIYENPELVYAPSTKTPTN